MGVAVTIPNDKMFSGRQNFTLRLSAVANSQLVSFHVGIATVSVIDNDGKDC